MVGKHLLTKCSSHKSSTHSRERTGLYNHSQLCSTLLYSDRSFPIFRQRHCFDDTNIRVFALIFIFGCFTRSCVTFTCRPGRNLVQSAQHRDHKPWSSPHPSSPILHTTFTSYFRTASSAVHPACSDTPPSSILSTSCGTSSKTCLLSRRQQHGDHQLRRREKARHSRATDD